MMWNGIHAGLRLGFLGFLAAASWQDARKGAIDLRIFQGFALYGVICQSLMLCIGIWEQGGLAMEQLRSTGSLAGAAGIGVILLVLSDVTKEGIGKGDGWFRDCIWGCGKMRYFLWEAFWCPCPSAWCCFCGA